jgi:hypothetical protein
MAECEKLALRRRRRRWRGSMDAVLEMTPRRMCVRQ